jgi:hypothetical protein
MKHLKNAIDNCFINTNTEIDKILKEYPSFLTYKKNNTFDDQKFKNDFIDILCKKYGNIYVDIKNFKCNNKYICLNDIERNFEIEYVKRMLVKEFRDYRKYYCVSSKIVNKYNNCNTNRDNPITNILDDYITFNDLPSHTDYQKCDQDRELI